MQHSKLSKFIIQVIIEATHNSAVETSHIFETIRDKFHFYYPRNTKVHYYLHYEFINRNLAAKDLLKLLESEQRFCISSLPDTYIAFFNVQYMPEGVYPDYQEHDVIVAFVNMIYVINNDTLKRVVNIAKNNDELKILIMHAGKKMWSVS